MSKNTTSTPVEMSTPCMWSELFNNEEIIILQEGYIITGFLSVLLGVWLNLVLLFSKLRFNPTYGVLANFTLAACIRRVIPVISHLLFMEFIEGSYELRAQCCDFFGFSETFLAVFEVECLTHACIERYVVAKYTTNGWPMKKSHYTLFLALPLFFATLYSFPPIFGLGRFGYDFSCDSCTFEMVLPDTWQKYFIVTIFILRSVKPAVIMIVMLTWARALERKYVCSGTTSHVSQFTRSIIAVTSVNLCCWTPIAMIRGFVVFSNLMNIPLLEMFPVSHIRWAMWIHWMAPAATVVTLFMVDENVRHEMFYFSKFTSGDEYKFEEQRKAK